MGKWLVLPWVLLLTACVSYYQPQTALHDGVYYAEDDPAYTNYPINYIYTAYYPWRSLDYFYLGYSPYYGYAPWFPHIYYGRPWPGGYHGYAYHPGWYNTYPYGRYGYGGYAYSSQKSAKKKNKKKKKSSRQWDEAGQYAAISELEGQRGSNLASGSEYSGRLFSAREGNDIQRLPSSRTGTGTLGREIPQASNPGQVRGSTTSNGIFISPPQSVTMPVTGNQGGNRSAGRSSVSAPPSFSSSSGRSTGNATSRPSRTRSSSTSSVRGGSSRSSVSRAKPRDKH